MAISATYIHTLLGISDTHQHGLAHMQGPSIWNNMVTSHVFIGTCTLHGLQPEQSGTCTSFT